MIITNGSAYRTLLFFFVIFVIGVVITVSFRQSILAKTEVERNKMSLQPSVTDTEERKEVPYYSVPKAEIYVARPDIEGFNPPEYPGAPAPDRSIRSNEIIENLLFALMFYGRVPEDKSLVSSVLGWDPQTGYYIATEDSSGAEIYAMARNVRYYLCLKIYEQFFPQTRYFEDEIVRVEKIVDQMVDPDYLASLFERHDLFFAIDFPHNIFHDLIKLTEVTGDQKFKNAAMYIGDKHSMVTVMQANLIKGNKDRSDKITMFPDAAMTYIYGKKAGKLDLIHDAELLMEELVEELWDENYSLFYTDATIGFGDSVTITFITRNQMDALLSLVRYSEASGNMETQELATKVLMTLAEGTNPLCDHTRFGFYRRYAGETRTPREDYKMANDHLLYLRTWVELNINTLGEHNNVLSYEYENYSNLLYDFTRNSIYVRYNMFWQPEPFVQDVALVSYDAMVDYLLMTLLDRKFRVEQRLGVT